MTLFQSLVRENKIKAAYLVARNEFYRKPAHSSYFEQYLEFCLNVGSSSVEVETRDFFIKEAEKALGHYTDHVAMNEKVLKEIVRYRQLLVDARESLERELQEERIEEHKRILEENEGILKQLQQLEQEIQEAEGEKDIEQRLVAIVEMDKKVRREAFTDRQQVRYETFSKEVSSLVEEKRKAVAKKEMVVYNKKAVEKIQAVFEEFKTKKEEYCNDETLLHTLAEQLIASYDKEKFFPETQCYYTYVYSYIFEWLDDKGKFALTESAVEAEGNKVCP